MEGLGLILVFALSMPHSITKQPYTLVSLICVDELIALGSGLHPFLSG